MKNKNAKTYIGIAIVAILALLLANPGWLPLSGEMKRAIAETERNNLLFQSDAHTTVAQLVTLVLAIALVWLLYQILKLILHAVGKRGGRALTVTNLISGLLKYVAVIAAVVWGLSILGVNATAVLAGVGIVGLILGFGAQSLIEDIITGAFIIFENQYSVGDIIILDDFRGTVRSIGVRTTVIEDAGGNLKVVNNSDIRNFQNRSRNNSVALVLVERGLQHRSAQAGGAAERGAPQTEGGAPGSVSQRAPVSGRGRPGGQRRQPEIRRGCKGAGRFCRTANAGKGSEDPLRRQRRGDPLPPGGGPQGRLNFPKTKSTGRGSVAGCFLR